MMGSVTLINTAAIILGGIAGHFTGKLFKQERQDALNKACGVSVLFIAIAYLSLIGSVPIFCVGINLVWGKTIRVANMLPAVLFAVLAAYLPIPF